MTYINKERSKQIKKETYDEILTKEGTHWRSKEIHNEQTK